MRGTSGNSKSRWTGRVILAASLALGACGDYEVENLEQKESQIIRASSNGGRNEVVMLYSVVATDTGFGLRVCTGSYYAPRVVLTAAHCLENILDADALNLRPQMFVYWGDNFEQDKNELVAQGVTFIPPPIGSPSHWAQADSIQIHPSWDPDLKYPDMGVVFLDRKPPFDPLPLLRSRVGANVPVTISGWGSNSAPTPTTGAGSTVQRTGTSRTLGSPTAADYHPEDPNPGMLNPIVRNNVIKLDGRAPNANTCFGDSGGPFIVRQFGQDYFAGVSYFGGLSCEDYSLFVRLDPFLPFVDLQYKRGGQDVLKPTFNCVAPNPSGTLTAFFGYRNDNGVVINIPYGTKNSAPRDTTSTRPKQFNPRDHVFSAAIDFAAGQTAVWTLSPDNNPTTTVTVNSSAPRCNTTTQQFEIESGLACRAQFRSGCAPLGTFAECSEGGADFFRFIGDFLPACVPIQTAWLNCQAATPPGSWDCSTGQSLNCLAQEEAWFNCLNNGGP